MANGCGKCVSYVTELNITDELHNPMGNVHHQLPGQRGSVTLHRMQMQDQPTVMVITPKRRIQTGLARRWNGFSHNPPVDDLWMTSSGNCVIYHFSDPMITVITVGSSPLGTFNSLGLLLYFKPLCVQWVVGPIPHGGPIELFLVPAYAPQLV